MPAPPILVAPDAFKGTLTAGEVASAVARGLRAGGWAVDECPVADGGEGTLDVLLDALGGERLTATVQGPLGRPLEADFGLLAGGERAVVEIAQASGLALVAESRRDAEAASSAGTGELILAAVRAGARELVVAVGGSATSDGGAGALVAIEAGGGLPRGVRVVVACDVRTPFERAAEVFGPQKGADPAAVRRLTRRLDALASELRRDPRGVPMTGAAGGLAGGLWGALGARLEPGAPFVLAALGFDARLAGARAVVVGEGQLDRQTLAGKAAGEIATRARQTGVPAHAIAGANALDCFDARILDLQVILEAGTPSELETAGRELAARL